MRRDILLKPSQVKVGDVLVQYTGRDEIRKTVLAIKPVDGGYNFTFDTGSPRSFNELHGVWADIPQDDPRRTGAIETPVQDPA